MVTILPVVLREMWRTPRGREVARKIAFWEVPMADFVQLPAMVMVTEFLKQQAFASQSRAARLYPRARLLGTAAGR